MANTWQDVHYHWHVDVPVNEPPEKKRKVSHRGNRNLAKMTENLPEWAQKLAYKMMNQSVSKMKTFQKHLFALDKVVTEQIKLKVKAKKELGIKDDDVKSESEDSEPAVVKGSSAQSSAGPAIPSHDLWEETCYFFLKGKCRNNACRYKH